jgi:hypothetical protein
VETRGGFLWRNGKAYRTILKPVYPSKILIRQTRTKEEGEEKPMALFNNIIQELQDMFSLYSTETRIENLNGEINYSLFYSALDSLDDVNDGFVDFLRRDMKPSIIDCLGFMQGLYIQQDAVCILSKVFGLEYKIWDDEEVSSIRNLRNRICGHPVKAGQHRTFSTSFFTRRNRSKEGFEVVIQYNDKWRPKKINFEETLSKNKIALSKQLLKIRDKAEKFEEKMFKLEHVETWINGVKQKKREKTWRTEYKQ